MLSVPGLAGTGGRIRSAAEQLAQQRWAAPIALGFVALYSAYARLFRLGASRSLIFDETYYVNAARRILGWHVAAGSHYALAPAGADPNSEHPPLGKLFMVVGMRLFGDNPLGWRFGSIIAGTAAIVAMYAMARAAHASKGLALAAAAVMALDNLFLVHARIATLDVYVLAFGLVAATAYLRGHPLVAGAVLGVGACTKLFAFYIPVVLFAFEAGRLIRGRCERADPWRTAAAAAARRLVIFVAVGVGVYLLVLQGLDLVVRPYDPNNNVYFSNALSHTAHMLRFAADQRSPHGPTGIASYPWQWFLNEKQIDYLTVTRTVSVGGVVSHHTLLAFRGAMNPFIIFLAAPALAVAAVGAVAREGEDVDLLSVSWVLGIFTPLLLQSVLDQRTSYLYYMLLVMPGIYLASAAFFARSGVPRAAGVGWAVGLTAAFFATFPIRSWPL